MTWRIGGPGRSAVLNRPGLLRLRSSGVQCNLRGISAQRDTLHGVVERGVIVAVIYLRNREQVSTGSSPTMNAAAAPAAIPSSTPATAPPSDGKNEK